MVNQTSTAAESVVIRADVPQNTSYVSNLGGGTLSANSVTWNIGTLGPQQSTSVVLSVELSNSLSNGDSVEFEASFDFSKGPEGGAGLIIFVSEQPELNLTKTASRSLVAAAAGQEIVYTLDYSNTGSEEPDAQLIDYLPTQTQLVSATGNYI
ncbi:DUF11 domain-containing protein [Halioglobus sp. HI00S01]|uniref:DUF11 domain-containing protein n=1 Tax=Halioglobus sp. HI00S01 TaxID=1822214 RepID=UPI0009EDEF1E|nr:DUF11 domain-containing protein [Halioglobus sp. HI00S01]